MSVCLSQSKHRERPACHLRFACACLCSGCVQNKAKVVNILQKASRAELKQQGAIRSDGTVLLDSGIVYFSAKATNDFLHLAKVGLSVRPPSGLPGCPPACSLADDGVCVSAGGGYGQVLPLSSCTSAGLDLGPAPLRFELYTDVLLCMNPAMTKADFLRTPLPDRKSDPLAVAKARELLWATFHPHPFSVIAQPGAHFAHLGTIAEYMHLLHHDSVSQSVLSTSS